MQQALKDKHRENSFKIFGYTPAEYRLGTDLFITFPRILSNLLYSLMLVGLTFFHYHQIFLVSLGLLLLVILCLPINYLARSKLFQLSFISDGIFAVINYPVFMVAVLLANLKYFSFELIMLTSIFIILLLLVSNGERLYKRYAFIRPRHNLLKELSLAITESSYPLVSQFFMLGLFLAIAIYLLYFVIAGHYLETSNDPGKIRELLYVFLPTSVLYNVQTSLSYYYAYDFEGQRMHTLKVLGNFISYKVKTKLKLAYLLSILPDSVFLVAFSLLYPDDDLIQYLIAYILCFLAHPLFFYLGSMYFPNYRRSMFDISQKLSNQALAMGVVLSTLVNLASAYYVWFTKTLLSECPISDSRDI
ncbi:hypothetical protein [Ligilactobacillus apodemi]|uniref:Uncharacterized protein n=1 Tax=Ligilactobacillus apodemi DSM 16634 = JCM 16172 TaxID=1423724 RepID=A0A0R1TQU1_9LACO|nr:hypothetical protein [Ligilactobacillus apodemi]KRL83825.1 hypothetical protein FC32_GL001088 [Ligilactobacillus apodemi DSM 16634 = JCM 16172]